MLPVFQKSYCVIGSLNGSLAVNSDEAAKLWLWVAAMLPLVGTTVGSFVPAFWGGSSLSLASVVSGLAGGIAGVWFGAGASGLA